jgi:hypothetical protein
MGHSCITTQPPTGEDKWVLFELHRTPSQIFPAEEVNFSLRQISTSEYMSVLKLLSNKWCEFVRFAEGEILNP